MIRSIVCWQEGKGCKTDVWDVLFMNLFTFGGARLSGVIPRRPDLRYSKFLGRHLFSEHITKKGLNYFNAVNRLVSR
jgi:hypothetical protein